jgi:Reverse transcriptase (RNA-dependent DNA polymerase)/Integrase core domain/GAG-pre-integrase domain
VLLMHEVIKARGKESNNNTTTEISENLHIGEIMKAKEHIWYLDSGASNHMTGCREHLTNFDTNIQGGVKLGDGSEVSIGGRGTVMIRSRAGKKVAIDDVYFIPKLTSNIISLGQLEERGCKVKIEDGWLTMLNKDGKLIIRVQRSRNRLYTLRLELMKPVCLKVNAEHDVQVWHARYGHLNFQALRKLHQEGMVEGLPGIEVTGEVCSGCLIGKQRRSPFPQEAGFRAEKALDLMHGDLCGPFTPPTPASNRYFLLLVDDYSRYMWIELLKYKDEAFSAFEGVKEEVEVEQSTKLKAFRTDRGGEFSSTEFVDYCKRKGVKRYLTAPYSPQQNGVVERRNQTVLGMVRCMLKNKCVPAEFWGEAAATAVYILNRAPTKSVTGMTPYEAWYKRKPRVDHFRVFGSIVHVKVTIPHQSKLADRSIKMILLGYEKGSKAYRVYNPITKKVHVTRDTVFEENKVWDWKIEGTSTRTPTGTGLNLEKEVGGGENEHQSENESDDQSRLEQIAPIVEQEEDPEGVEMEDMQEESHGTPLRLRSLDEIYSETEPIQLNCTELCLIGMEEPKGFVEAAEDVNWRSAMVEEINSIHENQTWSLVEPVDGQKVIGLKWVFKLKKNAEGKLMKHKARLVAKGYVQQQGIDFDDVFAPVTRMETIRLIAVVAVQQGWLLHHMDVKCAFLNGELKEEVYVMQPPGFEVKGKEQHVLRLHKALYGLKQAPRAWNAKLDSTLRQMRFERRELEHAVYKRSKGGDIILISVYVDDLLITGTSETEIAQFKLEMKEKFKMSDLGLLTYYLGIEVHQLGDVIVLSQENFAKRILKECRMEDCNSVQAPMEARLKLSKNSRSNPVDQTKYRSIVGSLRYLLHTRPDLAYSVGIVSRFMENPKAEHMAAVKHILRYVKGTITLGCCYRRSSKEERNFVGYSDSDMAGDVDDRKSTTGVIYFLGENVVSWFSRKQKVVALSSCEAEYIAAASAACQGVWLESLRGDLLSQQTQKIKLRIDNKSAISLCKNPVYHDRSKHIDTRFHYIRQCVEEGRIEVEHVGTGDQLADLLTKSLGRAKFQDLRERIGVTKIKMAQRA